MDTSTFQQLTLEKIRLCTQQLDTWPEFLQGVACNISTSSRTVDANSYFQTFIEMFSNFRVGTICMLSESEFLKQDFTQFMLCDEEYRHLKHIGWILDTNMLMLDLEKEEVFVYDRHTHKIEFMGSFCFLIFNVMFGPQYIPWASKSKDDWYTLLEDAGLVGKIT